MKKIAFIIVTIIATSFSFVHASENPEKVNNAVLKSFNAQFNVQGEVKWQASENHFTAYFVSNEHRMMAVYDLQGNYVGSARNILYQELPTAVSMSIEKNTPELAVYNILECNNSEGTYYLMTTENGGKKQRIRYTPSGVKSTL